MAQVVVRGIEEEVKLALKLRAQRNGHSMEEEVRQILRVAASEKCAPEEGLGTRIAKRFAGIGLTEPIVELRGTIARPAEFPN